MLKNYKIFKLHGANAKLLHFLENPKDSVKLNVILSINIQPLNEHPMRIIPLILSIAFCINNLSINAQNTIWEIDSMATMPEKVSNNAVCEGFIGNNPYVYSFAGIDSTKNWAGIHLKAWRYD